MVLENKVHNCFRERLKFHEHGLYFAALVAFGRYPTDKL